MFTCVNSQRGLLFTQNKFLVIWQGNWKAANPRGVILILMRHLPISNLVEGVKIDPLFVSLGHVASVL